MDKRVHAIVLNYNQQAAARKAMEELQRSRGIDVDVLMVDCASEPADQDMLRQHLSPDRLLLLPQNVGYAGGMNAGIRHWQERAPDVAIMLVTPDARIADNVALALWDALAADPGVGATGPVVVYRDLPNRKIGAGGEVEHGRITTHEEIRGSAPYDVGWVEGCCVMLRPAAVREIGGFDEEYFLYYEDVDLCERLRRAGWRVQVVPDAVVHHPKAAGQQPAHYYYYVVRNGYRFYAKNYGISTTVAGMRILGSIFWTAGIAIASLLMPTRWHEARARCRDGRLALRGAWSGTLDHLRGRYGRSAAATRRPA